ncbi:hypothetical protein CEP69_03880 [Citrobacter braakii]|nr:hypothetical protein CEP69_03880 [Citrobacter braakii]EAB1658081.1 hypothetical protein [Salmonella enterica]EAW1261705.1 hypothetical protein [Salmonella enterica subsp. diarizonae]EBF9340229.1 hypothetical protein [Salmonella enterica]EBK4294202.1 hypothetical protein [Salmonella enterica]
MSKCGSCAKPLRRSLNVMLEGVPHKSCPECSGRSGYHVFYLLEDFGDRVMEDGRIIPQSWCPACRSDVPSSVSPSFVCN